MPSTVTTDRGCQFESALWASFMQHRSSVDMPFLCQCSTCRMHGFRFSYLRAKQVLTQLQSMIFNMECAVVLMVIGTILSPSLTTPSAGKLSDFFPSDGMCGLSTEQRLEVLRNLQNAVPIANAGGVAVPECGPGPWLQVANFDSDVTPSQCPPEWPFISTPGSRSQAGCGQLSICWLYYGYLSHRWS